MKQYNVKLNQLTSQRQRLISAVEHIQLHKMSQDTVPLVSQIQHLDVEIPKIKPLFEKLEAMFKNLQDETQPLIQEIGRLNHELQSRSRPGTPIRPGGGRRSGYNRVKRNYSKTKKYNKKNSTSKKCKKNYSKMKRYKKNFY